MNIQITKLDTNTFLVTITERETQTTHKVHISDESQQKLNPNITKEELLKRSFQFLLQREPKESILKEFKIELITQYFSDYSKKMQTNL